MFILTSISVIMNPRISSASRASQPVPTKGMSISGRFKLFSLVRQSLVVVIDKGGLLLKGLVIMLMIRFPVVGARVVVIVPGCPPLVAA